MRIIDFKINISKLDTLSPLKVMSRGYSLVTKDNTIVISTSDLKLNDNINVKLKDGHVNAKIIEIINK